MIRMMLRYTPTKIAFLLLLHVGTASAQFHAHPPLLSGNSIVPGVYGVLERPAVEEPRPAVIILHAADGWSPAYAQLAKRLADSGFVALTVDYFAETEHEDEPWGISKRWSNWQMAALAAVRWLDEQPFVRKDRMSLLGFSRGAFLAVSIATSIPSLKAVVDYYGGAYLEMETVQQQVRNFPPLLILHGDADTDVPVTVGYALDEAVAQEDGEVEMHVYPGAGHAFNWKQSPNYQEQAAADSFRRTVEFLKDHLGMP